MTNSRQKYTKNVEYVRKRSLLTDLSFVSSQTILARSERIYLNYGVALVGKTPGNVRLNAN